MKQAKPTKVETTLSAKLEELATVNGQIEQINQQEQLVTAPHKQVMDQLFLEYGRKRQPFSERKLRLEEEITRLMQPNPSAPPAIKTFETLRMKVEIKTKTERTIDPADLFKAVPAGKRTDRFWECVSVLVTKVDEAFGDAFAGLVKTSTSFKAKFTLKG